MHLFWGCEAMIEIQLLDSDPYFRILPNPKTDGFLSNYHDTLCVRYNRLEEPPCLHRGLLWILREGHPFWPWCPHFPSKGTIRLISTQSQTAPSFLVHLQTKTPRFWSFENFGERWDQAHKRKAFTIAASFTNSAEPRLVAVCNDLRQVGHAVSQTAAKQKLMHWKPQELDRSKTFQHRF